MRSFLNRSGRALDNTSPVDHETELRRRRRTGSARAKGLETGDSAVDYRDSDSDTEDLSECSADLLVISGDSASSDSDPAQSQSASAAKGNQGGRGDGAVAVIDNPMHISVRTEARLGTSESKSGAGATPPDTIAPSPAWAQIRDNLGGSRRRTGSKFRRVVRDAMTEAAGGTWTRPDAKNEVRVCCTQMRRPRETWKMLVVLLLVVPALCCFAGHYLDLRCWGDEGTPNFFLSYFAVFSLLVVVLSTIRTYLVIYPGKKSDDIFDLLIFSLNFVFLNVYLYGTMNYNFSEGIENHRYEFRREIGELIVGEEFSMIEESGWRLNLDMIANEDEMWAWILRPYYENVLECNGTVGDSDGWVAGDGDCLIGGGKIARMHSSQIRIIRSPPYRDAEGSASCRKGAFYDARGWRCYAKWEESEEQIKTDWPLPLSNMTAKWQDGSFVRFNGERVKESMPFLATRGSFDESGYVINIPDTLSNSRKKNLLENLQQDLGGDVDIRYLALETVLVSPSSRQLAYVLVQFEFLPSGNLVPSIRVNSGDLPALNCDMEYDWSYYVTARLGIDSFFSGPCSLGACNSTQEQFLRVMTEIDQRGGEPRRKVCPEDKQSRQELRYRYGAGAPVVSEDVISLFLFMSFGGYFIFEETEELIRIGLARYLRGGWNYIDWLSVITMFVGVDQDFRAMGYTPQVTGPDEFLHIRMMLDRQLDSHISINLANLMMWLKVVKYLQWFKGFRVLGKTMELSFVALLSFLVIVLVFFFGFVFYFYFIFGQELQEFHSVFDTISTLLRGLNGDLPVDELTSIKSMPGFWGIFSFAFYIVVMVFVILGMLIAIISDAFVVALVQTKEARGSSIRRWLKKVAAPQQSDEARAYLKVAVKCARGLPRNEGFLGATTAYVQVLLAPKGFTITNPKHNLKAFKTKSIHDAQNPSWKARVEFQVIDPDHDRLLFYVFDEKASGRDLLLGKVTLPLSRLKDNGGPELYKYNLRPPGHSEQLALHPLTVKKPQGSLEIGINIRWRKGLKQTSDRRKSTGLRHAIGAAFTPKRRKQKPSEKAAL